MGKDDKEYKLQLSDRKYLTVSLFRNKCRVDIREFYDDNGEKKPGKKGVNMADSEFKVIIDNIEKISKKIKMISGEISDKESDESENESEKESD